MERRNAAYWLRVAEENRCRSDAAFARLDERKRQEDLKAGRKPAMKEPSKPYRPALRPGYWRDDDATDSDLDLDLR
jgi:hypothetical protein